MRAPSQSLTAGLVLSIVLLAGCLVLALLRPQTGAETAPIVMERQSGALYVRLGETLHPVMNLASARLIVRADADPQPMAASAISRSRMGALLGIPGAPQFLGKPLDEDESQWAVCDSRDRHDGDRRWGTAVSCSAGVTRLCLSRLLPVARRTCCSTVDGLR